MLHKVKYQRKGSGAMSKVKDTYKEIKTIEHPNVIVRIHIPDLTDSERARRMKLVHKASEELLKDSMKQKGERNYGT